MLTAAVIAVPAADSAGLNTLTAAEKADGWRLLFDGKTTRAGAATERTRARPGGRWSMARSRASPMPVTSSPSRNSRTSTCKFDWKISKNGNSGVFYHVAEGPDLDYVYPNGARVSAARQPRTSRREERTRPLVRRQLRAPGPTTVTDKPVGDWNESRIVVKGPHVEHWMNGVKVVEYELWSDAWKAQVAKSKFHEMPRYGLEKTGYIALQDHEAEVAFRNIKIKVLD